MNDVALPGGVEILLPLVVVRQSRCIFVIEILERTFVCSGDTSDCADFFAC